MTPEMIKYCEDFATKTVIEYGITIEHAMYIMQEAIVRRSPLVLGTLGIYIKGFPGMTVQEAYDAVDQYCKFDIKRKI